MLSLLAAEPGVAVLDVVLPVLLFAYPELPRILLGDPQGLPEPEMTVASVGTFGPTNKPVKDMAVAPEVAVRAMSPDETAAVNVVGVTVSTTMVNPFRNVKDPEKP